MNHEIYYSEDIKRKRLSEVRKGRKRMEDKRPTGTMMLKIELINDWDTDGEIERVLHAYGDVSFDSNTLSRDIVVPDDMPLYALSYCILRAFGFLNGHLHRFQLPKETNQKMLKIAKDWIAQCGVLFRSPMMNDNDYYWADDYEKGDFRKWQQSKYTGPYVKRTPGESYEECKKDIDHFLKKYPYVVFRKEKDDHGYIHYGIPKQDKNDYDETTHDLLKMEDCPIDNFRFLFERSIFELRECLTVSELFHDTKGIKKIIYEYDFGDGWEFEITEIKSSRKVNAKPSTIKKAEETCLEKYRPVCIAHEGGFLVEDVGGLGGYMQFLRAIHPEEEYHLFMEGEVSYDNNGVYESAEDARYWAESLEWTDQPIVDKKLL